MRGRSERDLFNQSSHQFLNWWQQHATGMLRLDFSNPFNAKTNHTVWCGSFLAE